jgi:hypothetical protein
VTIKRFMTFIYDNTRLLLLSKSDKFPSWNSSHPSRGADGGAALAGVLSRGHKAAHERSVEPCSIMLRYQGQRGKPSLSASK